MDFQREKTNRLHEIAKFPFISLQNVFVFLTTNRLIVQIRQNVGLTSFAFFLWRSCWRSRVAGGIFQQLFAHLICLLHKPWLVSERIIETVHFFREIFVKRNHGASCSNSRKLKLTYFYCFTFIKLLNTLPRQKFHVVYYVVKLRKTTT